MNVMKTDKALLRKEMTDKGLTFIKRNGKKAIVETNASYTTRTSFVKACEKANITPSPRQANKWRRKTGKAWEHRND